MERSVSGVGVVDKAVAVLDALETGPATLGDLVARSLLSRATAHRLASALERHGLVGRDAAGRFDIVAALANEQRTEAGVVFYGFKRRLLLLFIAIAESTMLFRHCFDCCAGDNLNAKELRNVRRSRYETHALPGAGGFGFRRRVPWCGGGLIVP